MTYYVYILYSKSKDLYYKGMSSNFEKRLKQHNSKLNKGFTSFGIPWIKMLIIEKPNKNEALTLEKKLKNLNRNRLEDFINKYK